ncbi:hypothetical protein NB311A_09089 [Nitrobacter sp. Nb-311A]|nr:hypothetical protein NB311A_09089 [Nitrobacter sp. Nb-311A]
MESTTLVGGYRRPLGLLAERLGLSIRERVRVALFRSLIINLFIVEDLLAEQEA